MNKPDERKLTPAASVAGYSMTGARIVQQEPTSGSRWRFLGRTGISAWLIVSAMAYLAPEPVHAWVTGGYRGYSSYGFSHHRPSHSNRRYRSTRAHRHYSGSRGCNRVSKTISIDGRLRQVTGSRCYDRHGNPYIKPGSRRLGGYYSN